MKLYAWNTHIYKNQGGVQYYVVCAKSVEIARKLVIEEVKKLENMVGMGYQDRINYIKETEPIVFEPGEVALFAYVH